MRGSFPMFDDGNVCILIKSNVFILHSPLLVQRSNTLRRLCGDISPDDQVYLTLVSTEDPDVTILEVQDYETFSAELEISSHPSNFNSNFNLGWPRRLRKCWTNLFMSFYNIDPKFLTNDPQSLTQEVRDIVRVAEEMEISFAGGMRAIERALLRLDQILFHAIAMYPASWAGLGKRMHSAVIYQESTIHIVGRWNSLGSIAIASLEPCTRNLCRRKHHELLLKKRVVECRLLSHYPRSMRRGGGGGSAEADTDPSLSCEAYAGDIYMWMVIAFFRQWMCFSLVDRKTLHAVDGGACFYRTIYHAGPETYLNARERGFFNMMFPMGAGGCDAFNAKMQELKQEVKFLVAPLLVNRCRYVFARAPPYLTCSQIDREDLPWDNCALDAVSEEAKFEDENPGIVNMRDVVLNNGEGSTTSRTLSAETPVASSTASTQNQNQNQNQPIAQLSVNSAGANSSNNVYNNYAYVNRRDHVMGNTLNPSHNTHSRIR